MYTVVNDLRIFMSPVADYDVKTRSHVFFSGGKEVVFRGEKELIRYLASHTETHGCVDSGRWSNEILCRQFAKGRPARKWTIQHNWYCTWTECWDYWFHDAHGRTIDVRLLWAEVVKAVHAGVSAETEPPIWKFRRLWRKSHTGISGGQRGHIRAILRSVEAETVYDEDDTVCGRIKPRGKSITTARYVGDWDWFRYRARHSTGWKEHKYRYQWEHNLIKREKHEKNRLRKENR